MCTGAQFFGATDYRSCAETEQHFSVRRDDLQPLLIQRFFGTPWGKLYDVAIIADNNLHFDTTMSSGEDSLFLWGYMRYVDKITVLPYATYCYFSMENAGKYNMSFEKMNHYLSTMLAGWRELATTATATDLRPFEPRQRYFSFQLFRGWLLSEARGVREFVDEVGRYNAVYSVPPEVWRRDPRALRLMTRLMFSMPRAGWLARPIYNMYVRWRHK